jgi:hypothetical protein
MTQASRAIQAKAAAVEEHSLQRQMRDRHLQMHACALQDELREVQQRFNAFGQALGDSEQHVEVFSCLCVRMPSERFNC